MKQAEKILTSSAKFHIELGLARISRILELLHNPHQNLKFVHIAGTNGKGSTCAILEEIFIKAGFKTGKFTSPHLFSYTERITVNKLPISDSRLDEIVEKINKLDLKYKIGLTEFEILTAAGFLYFAENACDIVVLEVGLGGRLDSTNVIAHPLVSIITSISLEHTERLGDTIEKIAKEKAGIIKKGSPVVVLAENKAYETLKNEAQRLNAQFYTAKTIENRASYAIINDEKFEFNLKGRHQGENLALALKALEIINSMAKKGYGLSKTIEFSEIRAALKDVVWKFRIEEREIIPENNGAAQRILIDACHNPDGARVLVEYLNEAYSGKRIKFVFGCLKNKDYMAVLRQFMTLKPFWCLCFYEFNYPNALKYKEFLPVFKEVCEDTLGGKIQDVAQFVRKTENPLGEIFSDDASCSWDLIVFCGSIYMLGGIFKDF